MLKPYALLLYVLSILLFFVVGAWVGKISGAAEGQGLAGGAIILFYGLVGSVISFVVSLVVVAKTNKRMVVTINKIFAVFVFIIAAWVIYRVQNDKPQEDTSPTTPTKVVEGKIGSYTTTLSSESNLNSSDSEQLGLGVFRPDIHEHEQIYFVNPLTSRKGENEAAIADSLVLHTSTNGNRVIREAPPWFFPLHMKQAKLGMAR